MLALATFWMGDLHIGEATSEFTFRVDVPNKIRVKDHEVFIGWNTQNEANELRKKQPSPNREPLRTLMVSCDTEDR